MSNIIWAFATVGCGENGEVQYAFAKGSKANALFETVAGAHRRIIGSVESGHLSNTCWAFAKLGYPAKDFFDGVLGQIPLIVNSGTVQNMGDIIWAYAKLAYKSDTLFETVAAQHGKIVGNGNVQNLSNILWAFATINYKSEVLFEAVARQVSERAREPYDRKVPKLRAKFLTYSTIYLSLGRSTNELFQVATCRNYAPSVGRLLLPGTGRICCLRQWRLITSELLETER